MNRPSAIESQVAYLEGPEQLVFKSDMLYSEQLSSHQILCETQVSAISPGTETAAYKGLPPLRPGKTYPRLVGYCNVARVIACGSDVSLFKTGDRVLSAASHRSHFVSHEKDIWAPIPDQVSDSHASCAYLYHLGYNAILKSQLMYGQTLLVIGLGTLGLGTVTVARNAGATVFAISDQAAARETALACGAEQIFSRKETTTLMQQLGLHQADIIVVTTNSWEDWQLALQLTTKHGTIAVMGFPGRDADTIPFNPLASQYFYDKQLTIKAVGQSPTERDTQGFLKFNEKDNLRFLLEEIKRKRINPDNLISGTFPWHALNDAYQQLITRHNSPVTYLLQWKN